MHKSKYIVAAAILASASIAPAVSAIDYTGAIGQITISSDESITLNNATIDVRSTTKQSGITIQPGATLTLTLQGENTIYAGACAAGINVMPKYNGSDYDKSGSAKLIIKGSGNLTVKGGSGDVSGDEFECGSGAGIGGNGSWSHWDGWGEASASGEWDWAYAPDFGTITIDSDFSGTINANAGTTTRDQSSHRNENSYGGGAGIGGGGSVAFSNSPVYHSQLNGEINIKGGTINASGHNNDNDDFATGGAGIGTGGARGGGYEDNHNDIKVAINISGGNVTAKGGAYASGIGGGSNQNSGFINISGGKINAECGPSIDGDPSGSGIGAGDIGSLQEINITGGDITARGLASAGIGGGYEAITNNAIFSKDPDTYFALPNIIGKINISGANTKVLAISDDAYDDYDVHGDRVKSGAGIGSGAPYIYSSQAYNDYYLTYQSLDHLIRITDHATVTAFGGKYANGVGAGGSYFERGGGHFYNIGVDVIVDDTVDLFASNLSDSFPALPQVSGATEWYGSTPITFNSADRFLVQQTAGTLSAHKTLPSDESTTATYSLSGNTLSVAVDGYDATTHETTTNYVNGNSFAVISGAPVETPTSNPEPENPVTSDETENYILLVTTSVLSLATLFVILARTKVITRRK